VVAECIINASTGLRIRVGATQYAQCGSTYYWFSAMDGAIIYFTFGLRRIAHWPSRMLDQGVSNEGTNRSKAERRAVLVAYCKWDSLSQRRRQTEWASAACTASLGG
jgi:hypothetical protein